MNTTDWFLYDKQTDMIARFTNNLIICYASYLEACEDRYDNEKVIQFKNLPIKIQTEYIQQLKQNG